MPKKKSKPKGMTPEQVAKANRDNIDYQMQVNPMLQFDDIMGNSNQMMSGMLGNAMPIIQGMMNAGAASTGAEAPNMMDILAQMQMPQQPQQPQVANTQPPGQPAVGQPPQVGANPYGLTPQQMAHIQQNVRGPGRGIV